MKNYKAPELEIVKFSHEDIMTSSSVALEIGSSGGGQTGEHIYQAAPGAETKFGTFDQ